MSDPASANRVSRYLLAPLHWTAFVIATFAFLGHGSPFLHNGFFFITHL